MKTPSRSETDAAWIVSQLRKTQAEMERLKKRSQGERVSDVAAAASEEDKLISPPLDSTKKRISMVMDPEQKLHLLSELDSSLEYLELLSDFLSWEEDQRQKISNAKSHKDALMDCVKLTQLLLRFPPHWKQVGHISNNLKKLHQIIWNRYMSILQSTRCNLSTLIQKTLTDTGYPNESNCYDLLSQNLAEESEEEEREDMPFTLCCTQLVTLQAIHENFMFASSSSVSPSHMHVPWQRIDIVTEFCRPIVVRVRYHFTSSSPEFSSDRPTSNKTSSTPSLRIQPQQQTQMDLSRRYDRVVQWLLAFIRESMRTPLELLRRYIDDLVRRGWNDAMDLSSSTEMRGFQLPLPAHLSQYFLREMVLLARHVLQGGCKHSGGSGEDGASAILSQQSSALCTILSDDVLFCTSMEQMLRFDEYIQSECAQNIHANTADNNNGIMLRNTTFFMAPIPRLTGIVTYQHDRFCRWIELEHDAAMHTLSSTPLPNTDQQSVPKSYAEVMSGTSFPPFVETLVSLLYSADMKCRVAFSPIGMFVDSPNRAVIVPLEQHQATNYHLVEYLNGVHVPLIMSYMDATRKWAKQQVRHILNCVQRLLRPVASKSWGSTAGGGHSNQRTGQIPIYVLLNCLMRNYCKMTGGTACIASLLSAQALHWENIETSQGQGRQNDCFPYLDFHSEVASSSSILKRMNDSASRLSNAMVDELATSLTECMTIDDASVASYMMRIHYILQEECYEAPENDPGKNTKVSELPGASLDQTKAKESRYRSSNVSQDLMDFISTLSSTVGALNSVFRDHSLDVVIAAEMLKSNFADRLSSKFIETILDAPELSSVKGSLQVALDMQTIAEFFFPTIRLQGVGSLYHGSFDRLTDIVKLMTLDRHQFLSLREAFNNLVLGYDLSHNTDYEEVDGMLECLTSDEKIAELFRDMLRAKGFPSLNLRDALVVLHRRHS